MYKQYYCKFFLLLIVTGTFHCMEKRKRKDFDWINTENKKPTTKQTLAAEQNLSPTNQQIFKIGITNIIMGQTNMKGTTSTPSLLDQCAIIENLLPSLTAKEVNENIMDNKNALQLMVYSLLNYKKQRNNLSTLQKKQITALIKSLVYKGVNPDYKNDGDESFNELVQKNQFFEQVELKHIVTQYRELKAKQDKQAKEQFRELTDSFFKFSEKINPTNTSPAHPPF